MRTRPRRLGLLGGITWHSSLDYERRLNEGVNAALGGSSSADLVVRSYDFQQIADAQKAGDWAGLGEQFAADAVGLQNMGAEAILICANTMHLVAPAVEAAISVPLIHVVDETAKAIKAAGASTVALLGTGYTMRAPFYRERMAEHGVTTVVPDEPRLTEIHDLIFEKLARGIIDDEGRSLVREASAALISQGAEGVIAGCTEIPLVLGQEDLDVPFFDSLEVHVKAALEFALAE